VVPENWSGCFVSTSVAQRSRQSCFDVESAVTVDHLEHGCLEVHRVVMDEVESMLDQILRLLNALSHTIVLDCLIIVFDSLERIHDFLRHDRFSELAHALESVVAKDWHNAGDDWHSDSSLTTVTDPVIEDFVVVEELRYDEVSACVHFCLQVLDVIGS
jgi:hypothetical protein